MTATLPILWICLICAAFAHPQGLFIVHFRWPAKQVSRAMRYYKMSIWLIVPLIMALITFDSLKEREFANTLGRLCFILLCLALALVTHSLKRAGIPLYLDKNGSGDNMLNSAFWGCCCRRRCWRRWRRASVISPPRRRCWRAWKPRWRSGSCCWSSTTSSAAGC